MTEFAQIIQADNFDDLYSRLCLKIMENPQYECAPRGNPIKEVLVQTLILENPRARILSYDHSSPTNYGFAAGEFLWYWSGKRDLETMLYYNKRMKDFSDNGKTLNSAYGHRLRTEAIGWNEVSGSESSSYNLTQWKACVRTLLLDHDSRRAVMTINQPTDEAQAVSLKGSKDVPCTLSLQFFIRDGKLDLHVLMRSNDVFWGLKYDLFSFTLFQECMLQELREAGYPDLQLGTYYHTAGSMHIYERHFAEANKISQEHSSDEFTIYRSTSMDPIDLAGLARLVDDEFALRTRKVESLDEALYIGGTRWMAQRLNQHRRKRDAELGGRSLGSGDGHRPEANG